jgi:hypothetical protein
MPHLQKSAVIRDFFLDPWVNSLHTQPDDSFAIQPVALIGAGHQYTQPIAASLPPAPGSGSCNFRNTLLNIFWPDPSKILCAI